MTVKNKATDDELRELIAAAELAGVGKGQLEAVILGAYDFASNGRVKPIDRLTSKQCTNLIAILKNAAAKSARGSR